MSMLEFSDNVRAFVDCERWTFAKTMPEWPHEYLVRSRVDELFLKLRLRISEPTAMKAASTGALSLTLKRAIGCTGPWVPLLLTRRSSIDAAAKTLMTQEGRRARCQRDTRPW